MGDNTTKIFVSSLSPKRNRGPERGDMVGSSMKATPLPFMCFYFSLGMLKDCLPPRWYCLYAVSTQSITLFQDLLFTPEGARPKERERKTCSLIPSVKMKHEPVRWDLWTKLRKPSFFFSHMIVLICFSSPLSRSGSRRGVAG